MLKSLEVRMFFKSTRGLPELFREGILERRPVKGKKAWTLETDTSRF